jgi:hypothetical protein
VTTPTWQFWLAWPVSVLAALGTLSAVVVALFGNVIRHRYLPPHLTLSLKNEVGIQGSTTLTAPDGTKRETACRWYHLRVENKNRWSYATQTQVFLLRVESPDAAGHPQLMWDGEVPMRWRYQEAYSTQRTLGPPADVDLCSITKDKWLLIEILFRPEPLRKKYKEPCNLTLTLQAKCIEGDSNILRVRLAWDGKWAEDSVEMKRHAAIRVAEKVTATAIH